MFVELASRLLLTWLAASPLVTTSLAQATPGQPTHGHSQGVIACHELAAKFPSLVFGSNTSTYANQSALPWSETCLLSPSCVFLPHKAADVAGALPLIKRARSPFAVISVGHMPVPGASTSEGVLISLNQLSELEYAKGSNKTIAQIGPGNKWLQVYQWLAQSGRAVNGGRYGQVGVGGLLLGGGIGYFSSKMGWGADSVVQYEVVLENGSIVLVDRTSHPDLFWALKGGSNNFGIVTRYDMVTMEVGDAFASGIIWKSASTTQWFEALNAYMAPGGGVEDVNAAIMPIVALTPEDGTYEVISLEFYSEPVASPKAFENFTAIEGPTRLHETNVGSWMFLATALDTPAYAAKDYRQLFWAVSFRPDPRAISIANHTVFDQAMVDLKNVTGCTISFSYQPISKAWLQASKALGGDAIGLDPEDGPFIAGLISSTWSNAEDDDTMYQFSRNAAKSIRRQTEPLGLYHPFVFLNDAGKGQDPFPAYGGGKSLRRMREIQANYDPEGFLKNHLAHGFPL
ncbi:FAD linked oxidase, N-terminal [Penicillium expansum]|nr:FAD linked oxidase, N-terminal [Penicillium expansum]